MVEPTHRTVKVVLLFDVMADSDDTAKEIVQEGMQSVKDTLSDIHCYEWHHPTIATEEDE